MADDLEIVRRVLQGQVDDFAELIARHQQHVARIVGRHVPADHVGEVAHEVFIRAYGGLSGFSAESPFDHWLAGIAIRTCYDFWRARHRDELPVSDLTDDHQQWMDRVLAAESDERFREETGRREAKDVLDWALQHLSAEDRLVLTLVHLEGLSVREAAHKLDWSVANVKVRAHRARRALRKLLLETQERKGHDTVE